MRELYRRILGILFVGTFLSLLSGLIRYHTYCAWMDLGFPCGEVRGWPFAYYELTGRGYFDNIVFVLNTIFYFLVVVATLIVRKVLNKKNEK